MVTSLFGAVATFARPSSNPFAILNFVWLIVPILTIGIMAAVFIPIMRRGAQRTRLLQTGEAAQAKVLGLADTGTLINNNPQIQLMLEVYPQTRPPFQAQCVAIVSYLAIPRIQPGMMVPVRFDPADPSKIALAV